MTAPRYHRHLPAALSAELWRQYRRPVMTRAALGTIAAATTALVLPATIVLGILYGGNDEFFSFGDMASILLPLLFIYGVLAFGAAHWMLLRIGRLTRRRYVVAGSVVAILPLLSILSEPPVGGDAEAILGVAVTIVVAAVLGAAGGLVLWAIAIRENPYFDPRTDAVVEALGEPFE